MAYPLESIHSSIGGKKATVRRWEAATNGGKLMRDSGVAVPQQRLTGDVPMKWGGVPRGEGSYNWLLTYIWSGQPCKSGSSGHFFKCKVINEQKYTCKGVITTGSACLF